MTEPVDPPRLVDPDSSASPRLRELLAESRADVGTEVELRALSAALGPTFGTGLAATSAKATVPFLVKVALVVGASAAAGGAYLVARDTRPAPAPRPVPAAALPAPAPEKPAAVPTPAQAATTDTAPSAVAPESEAAASSRTSAKHPGTVPSEADLLGAAQVALGSDPARALTLAEQHQRAYPGGTLGQEREVIAIEALQKLGRGALARARGDRFLAAHPKSAYREKIQSILGVK